MSLDINLFYFLNNLAGQSHTFDALVVFLAEYLQYFLIALFFLLVYFSGCEKRWKLQILWVTGVSAVVARLGITELIRLFYHRPRPFAVYHAHQLLTDSAWSFPSGHATFFFAMASAIYLYNKKWGIGFFIATILMTASRVIAGVHYPSDILGGMLIGIAVAYVVFYLAEKRRAKEIMRA